MVALDAHIARCIAFYDHEADALMAEGEFSSAKLYRDGARNLERLFRPSLRYTWGPNVVSTKVEGGSHE